MKKLIPLLALPLFLAGCGNNNTGADTNAPASSEMTNTPAPGGAPMATNVDTNMAPPMMGTNMPANGSTNTPP